MVCGWYGETRENADLKSDPKVQLPDSGTDPYIEARKRLREQQA